MNTVNLVKDILRLHSIKMKFFVIVALFAGALAAPTSEIEPRAEYNPCPNGLYSSPVCADTDVLGLLCLTTVTRE